MLRVSAVADGAEASATWSSKSLADAFTYATEWLAVYVEETNALNVYPVPDGDTGTNMHLTMQSVRRHLGELEVFNFETVARALSYGSLLGARGNSGVILSQILKGVAEAVKDVTALTGAVLTDALLAGSEAAYAAVMTPVEGTILTVIRKAAEAAQRYVTGPVHAGSDVVASGSPLEVLEVAFAAGEEALAHTPEQLPILKQAGVVDAGGHGLMRLVEGLIAHFQGLPLPAKPEVTHRAQQQFEEEEFGFCTEFLLADVEAPTEVIRDLVAPYGDSLLVVGAEGFVKGHIHTEEPEKLLAEVSRYGRMVRSKVEDMSEQHTEILADVDAAEAEAPRSGAVAVSDGYGVTNIFRSLGLRVVGGGQTDNPSVQDIVDAVNSVGAGDVIILPNNKNIIMAAERVRELLPKRNVQVLPTRTLGQGLAAAIHFHEAADIGELMPAMQEGADSSVTLEVTRATRDVELNGLMVSEGDAIGLVDGELVTAAGNFEEALTEMISARADEYDVALLFYSAEVGAEAAAGLVERMGEEHPHLEVELKAGAPDLYPYLMVLE